MSWVRVWIHLVFTTKNRYPFLVDKEVREKIFKHILQNSKEKEIWLNHVNGHKEHIHCLLLLGKEQNISKIAQLIKGESSYWINKNRLISGNFEWQDDFWAVSVSENLVPAIGKYIEDQDEHHKKKTFDEEVDDFMKKYR